MDASGHSTTEFSPAGEALGRWWSRQADGRILCELCPRSCRLKDGDRGFCFVRKCVDGRMVLDTYGRSTGFCIDPIEKKPLNHFLPGTPVLSFGTAGCNLGCKFCQNWDISKSRETARLSDRAMPDDIAAAASEAGCRSVAFTYNDPVIWAEYALDTAAACRAIDIRTVAVTAGYITPQARQEFFASMDAANIDLKAFTEDFYHKLTGAHLEPILDTIRYVANETDCWLELTNLIIPNANDGDDELRRMSDWVLAAVGDEVPVHFTAFHPDFRMKDRPPTGHDKLIRAYDLARQAGLKYVYLGNVHDVARQSTFCPSCGQLLIERDWHQLGRFAMRDSRCAHCDYQIAGRFDQTPGSWGRTRQPVRIVSNQAERTGPQPGVANHQEPTMRTSRSITPADLTEVHRVACQAVTAAVQNQSFDPSAALGELASATISGIFITLKRGATLRGCCGMQGGDIDLATALSESATRTAKHDPRMAPIAPVELPHLSVSVSVLGPSRPIEVRGDERMDAVEVGKHGLRIRLGGKAGLLLPVVATERAWSSRQFLDAVCNKAGLPPGSWRSDDAEIELFEGIEYRAPLTCPVTSVADVRLVDDDQLTRLRSWVQSNIVSFQSGATPQYYADGVDDHTVAGVILRVAPDPGEPSAGWLQLSIRDGMPLQSTLLQMTETAARALARRHWVDGWRADIAILSSVVHHGTDDACELAEVDCRSRALLAMDGRRWSVTYDRAGEREELLDRALQAQSFRHGATQVYSACCDSTEPSFQLSSGPQPTGTISARSPAVAGTFYPRDDDQRISMVTDLLGGLPAITPRPVCAAMVPHAGLKYSGRIAADVWRRIALPETVLIIGPKHTGLGVDWAVAPHDCWQLSGTASMPGDVALARQIAEQIPAMELDAAAHSREHGIEVQLPILHRLAPRTKIAAIAMSGAGFAELRDTAQRLAKVLRSQPQLPLLVISSDLNHFADEEENRRRDRLALQQLQAIDPLGLLETCTAENISMCGQVPAALVLLTLQAMGLTPSYDEIGYDTSASTSGDKSRVVGYAGVLF